MPKNPRLELFEDAAHNWRWRVKAANGLIIGDSGEGYVDRQDALHGALLVFFCLESERAAGQLKGVQ